jgi:predicted nucleotide-binding protein
MRVFLSWSGDRSRRLAEALRDWLPAVLQSVEPWLSAVDISKGARWSLALSDALKQTDAGVICLTRENSQAGWLLFEAGAISNIPSGAFVAVYLLDHRLPEVSGPLAQFQCTEATRDDTLRLVSALNTIDRSPLSEQRLHRAFEVWWPQLEAHLTAIRATAPELQTARSTGDKLDEILELIRGVAGTLQSVAPIPVATVPVTPQALDVKRAPTQGHRPAVFIGSSAEGLNVARAIQENLDEVAECTIWDQDVFQPSMTFIETLVDVSAKHEFAVVVLTPDDVLEKRGERAPAARDNLLFELGLFTGTLGRARTFLVLDKTTHMHLPTDLSGVTAVTYQPRKDHNLIAALGPVCNRIRRAIGAG